MQVRKLLTLTLAMTLLLTVALPSLLVAQTEDSLTSDSDGAIFSAIGDNAETDIDDTNLPSVGLLTQKDYELIYTIARNLTDQAVIFRQCQLQMRPHPPDFPCAIEPSQPDTPKYAKSYQDGNSKEFLNLFCEESIVLADGSCAQSEDYRSKLVAAHYLFLQMYLVEPQLLTIKVNDQDLRVKELGVAGILETTREIVLAHMIFASEYAIDALDYRFTLEGMAGSHVCIAAMRQYEQALETPTESYNYFTDADCIIQHEIELLEKAKKHQLAALDIVANAFNRDAAWPLGIHLGDLFTPDELDIFASLAQNYVVVVDEIALRHRQLGDEIHNDGTATAQYVTAQDILQGVAQPFVQRAKILFDTNSDGKTKAILLANTQLVNAQLDKLQSGITNIQKKIDLFGYQPDYMPLQSYAHLKQQADYLVAQAQNSEDKALTSTREWELDDDQLKAQNLNIQTTYVTRLREICGANTDKYKTCNGDTGSLLDHNWYDIVTALLRIDLTNLKIQNTWQTITDTLESTAQITVLLTVSGEEIAANELAAGIVRSYQIIGTTAASTSKDTFTEHTETNQTSVTPGLLSGVLGGFTAGEKLTKVIGLLGSLGSAASLAKSTEAKGVGMQAVAGVANAFFGSTSSSRTTADTTGTRFSQTKTNSMSTVYNPNELELAELNSANQILTLASEIGRIEIQSEYQVKQLYRQLAELQVEQEVNVNEFNRASAEHNDLLAEWQYWQALYTQAGDNQESSYLANPAHRLLRDHDTEIARAQLLLAAHQAYLTAKALQIKTLATIDDTDGKFKLSNIFKARNWQQVAQYLAAVDARYDAFDTNQQISEDKVEISLADLVTGIINNKIGDSETLQQKRNEAFQQHLQTHLFRDVDGKPEKLLLPFSTSLLEEPLNDPGRYNWRIAGATTGATQVDGHYICYDRQDYGISISLDLSGSPPPRLPDNMKVTLIQFDNTSYRNIEGTLVNYSPKPASILSSQAISSDLKELLNKTTVKATISISPLGDTPSNKISDFCNRSVAAGDWLLEIDLQRYPVPLENISDIIIRMQTFYYNAQ